MELKSNSSSNINKYISTNKLKGIIINLHTKEYNRLGNIIIPYPVLLIDSKDKWWTKDNNI